MHGRSNKRHQDGDESPGDHDPSKPFARAPSLDDEAAWNFEEQVADKEYSRAEAEDPVAEIQIVRHFECRITHVHAVQKCDHKKSEEEWQEAPRNAAPRDQTSSNCGNGQTHTAWASNITSRGLHANEKLDGGSVFGNELVNHADYFRIGRPSLGIGRVATTSFRFRAGAD